MRRFLAVLLAMLLSAGCTAASLARHTVNQAVSVSDMRCQQVLDGLARLRVDPGALPPFAVLANGASVVTDTVGIESTTVWDQAFHGFSKETLTPSAKHNPDPSWTLDPVVAAPHMDALHGAFLWVLRGPPEPGSPALDLLSARGPNDYRYHFDVARDLAALPPTPSWLHVTSRTNIPKNASYKAASGDAVVSVTPDGMAALSALTLIVLDIATTDPASLPTPVPTAAVEREICIQTVKEPGKLDVRGKCNFCQTAQQTEEVLTAMPQTYSAQPPSGPSSDQTGSPGRDSHAKNPCPPPPKNIIELDSGKTVVTENWFVYQDCKGEISVLYPGWCDNRVVKITPYGADEGTSPTQEPHPMFQSK